jgi:hypothetical protein
MSHCYFPVAFLTQAPVPFRISLISMAFVANGICGIHSMDQCKSAAHSLTSWFFYCTTRAFSNKYVCPSGLVKPIEADPAGRVGTVQDNVCVLTSVHEALLPPIVTVVPATKPLPFS